MAASDSDMRAWAREHDVPVNTKGAVSKAVRDAYSAAHNGGGPGPDYPDGMTDADFDLAEAITPDDAADLEEITPRPAPKATSSSARGKLSGRFARAKPGGSKAKGKRATQRVSTADLIGSTVRILAKVAQPMPPLYRVFRLESVIAGPLVDDAIKGTFVDTVLQPLARVSQAGETAAALILPPAAIAAMAWHLQQTEGKPNPVVLQGCQEALRHGLMAMMRVGGEAFADQLAKERDDEERYGGSVDQIMAWLLSDPADPGEEEANIARMAARMGGQPEPETMPV